MIFPQPKNPDGSHPKAIFDQRVTEALSNQARTISVQGQRVCRTTRGSYTIPGPQPITSGGKVLGPFVLQDVFDDYLVCGQLPTVPKMSPPLDPPITPLVFIGSLHEADFQNDTNIWLKHKDTDLPDSDTNVDVLYQVKRSDYYFSIDFGTFYAFSGSEWIEMDQSDTQLRIAKEQQHRLSRVGEVVMGVQFTFMYQDGPEEDWAVGTSKGFNPTRIAIDPDGYNEWQIVSWPWMENELIYAIPAMTGATYGRGHGDMPKGTSDYEGGSDTTGTAIRLLITGRSCQWAHQS
jgi:hypothetical protein